MFFLKKKFPFLFFVFLSLFLPAVGFALELNYPPMLGFSLDENSGFPEYAKYFFNLGMALAGILAVLAILFGAVNYLISMGMGKFTDEAKEWIKSGLIGAVLILSSYILASTINPDLVIFKLDIPFLNSSSDTIGGDSSKTPIIFYDEIPIGTLTENLLTKEIDCYDFDENGNPIPKEVMTNGGVAPGPTFLKKDRVECMAKLSHAIERKTYLSDKLSKEIVKLMQTCSSCANSNCQLEAGGQCAGGIQPLNADGTCPPMNCGKIKCECKNPCQDLCPTATREKIEHGIIQWKSEIPYADYFEWFPLAKYEDIRDFAQCMSGKGFFINFRGLDEFRNPLPISAIINYVEIYAFANKEKITIIDVDDFKNLKLIEQLMYLKEKMFQIKRTIDADLNNLTSAEGKLTECRLAKPYVEFLKLNEQTKDQNLIIIKEPYLITEKDSNGTFQNQPVQIANYCNGYEYSGSECYTACENMCPSFSPQAAAGYKVCPVCNTGASNYLECMAKQKTCMDEAYNKRPCPGSASNEFSDFQGCINTCKNDCGNNCFEKYTECKKMSDACENCLPGDEEDDDDEEIIGFNLTGQCDENCLVMCPNPPSVPFLNCQNFCFSVDGCNHMLNESDRFGCIANSTICYANCEMDEFFAHPACLANHPPENCAANPKSSCEQLCGTCDYIPADHDFDKLYCEYWIKPECLGKCQNVIDGIKNYGQWPCPNAESVPLQNRNQCFFNCQSSCSSVCISTTKNLDQASYNACNNCLLQTIGMGLNDTFEELVSGYGGGDETDQLTCDPILKKYCGEDFKKCQDSCKDNSKCILENRENCLLTKNGIAECAGDSAYDSGNLKNCSDKSFLCQYGSDQQAGYNDVFKKSYILDAENNPYSADPLASLSKDISSSGAYENPENLKCPNCYQKIFFSNSSNPSLATSVVCKNYYPEVVKGPSCSNCPNCPCDTAKKITDYYKVQDARVCGSPPAPEPSTSTYYRVVSPSCQNTVYNDDPLTFYCRSDLSGGWYEDDEKTEEPKGVKMDCKKDQEIPVGQTVDDAEKWARDLVKNYLNSFMLSTDNFIEHLKRIGNEQHYCFCDSQCGDNTKACNAPCTQQVVINPITGKQNCACAKGYCAGSPCQKMINLLQGLCPAKGTCPENSPPITGINDWFDILKRKAKLLIDFTLVGRTDILKGLVYSRKSADQCSLRQKNFGEEVNLYSCTHKLEQAIPPFGSVIINNKERKNLCYGADLTIKYGIKIDGQDPIMDNWFCCEEIKK